MAEGQERKVPGKTAPEAGESAMAPGGDGTGTQRLSIERLRAWESMGLGLFLHFGLSTYLGEEIPDGTAPASLFAPDALDVDQWVSVARDAGVSYLVLTAKHVSGHCLWPSEHSEHTVAASPVSTDVVAAFCEACERRGVKSGFYYCTWDNHHRFGTKTPSDPGIDFMEARVTDEYFEFQTKQVEELLTKYGPWEEVWIDIPVMLGNEKRRAQYEQIARLSPESVIMMNSGFTNGSAIDMDYSWPADLIAVERYLPDSNRGHKPWFQVEGEWKYVPAEVCDPIGYEWFWDERDTLRSDEELLGMFLITRARRSNLLLNVPPDRSGRIPEESVQALQRLRRNVESLGG